MGSIPFSAKEPLVFRDDETGVEYLLRHSTDETELELIALANTFGDKFRDDAKELRRWINGNIDILLCGWRSEKCNLLPAFPDDGHPAQMMQSGLKIKIIDWWRSADSFSLDELKK